MSSLTIYELNVCFKNNDNIMYLFLSYFAVDTVPPQISNCPKDIEESMEVGNMSKQIFWTEPQASDLSGSASLSYQSHKSGGAFGFGKTEVTYKFSDKTENSAICKFRISITPGNIL